MKILLVNSTCKVGGVSTFMLTLRSALTAQGHSCDLFFFEHGTMDAHLPAGCPVRFGSLADCLELVARERYDVVHANNVDWPTGVSAVRRLGARLVVTAHKVREGAWTYGWNSTNCDAMTAVSRWIAAALQPFTDVPVQVVYNGIDVARFRERVDAVSPFAEGAPGRPPAAPIVAWVGRSASPLKGLEKFAEIAPALHRGGVRVWVIDQHGPDRASEVYPAASAALRSVAERWNSVDVDDMPALYRDIAESGGCVLATSVAEGLGLAMLEAQASGCLVVASDVRGHDESVSRAHGGLRFPLDTDAALVARLVLATLADRPQVRARQAAAADFVRRQFSVERMARQYEDIYEDRSTPVLQLSRRARRRGRRRLSPLMHWHAYVTQRLGVGYVQLAASQQLLAVGQSEAASAAGLAALATSPTMFIKPARLALLARALRRHVVDHQHRLVVGRHDAAGVARIEDLH